MLSNQSPRDLATTLCSELGRRKVDAPTVEVATALFETMYFASLKTEESQAITFHIVYLDPENPDPKPPRRLTKDRWKYVRFDELIELNIQNIVKIAKASDPRSSSFAIYSDRHGNLYLWGLIDQQNLYHKFINHDANRGPERPGIFQASIVGIGHLVTYIKYEKVAELKVNTIVKGSLDVLRRGLVSEALNAGKDIYLDFVEKYSANQQFPQGLYEEETIIDKWHTTLCRLLLRIHGYRHGGTVLITPDPKLAGLNIKYKLNYSRLKTSLETFSEAFLRQQLAQDEIWNIYNSRRKNMPVELHRQLVVAERDLEENGTEIEGALWFVSLLSRVDGAIVLNSQLEVLGFGAEITINKKPNRVCRARTSVANEDRIADVDYNHFGTRHRSVMRYCAEVPGAVGFVISQDGDVRAFLLDDNRVVMWENIKLQYFESIPRRRARTQKA